MALDEETKQAMREAVASGIREVLSDKEIVADFWSGAFEQLQESAQRHTGRILLGSLGAVAKRVGLFVTLGLIVYAIGGWSAIVKLWHALTSGA